MRTVASEMHYAQAERKYTPVSVYWTVHADAAAMEDGHGPRRARAGSMADAVSADQKRSGGLPRAADFHFFAALAAPLLDEVQRAATSSNDDLNHLQSRKRKKQGKQHTPDERQSNATAAAWVRSVR